MTPQHLPVTAATMLLAVLTPAMIGVWSIDGNDRLVLTSRIESLTFNSVEAKAVFDRQ